jgi:ABC-2 type transport system permease protein
VVHGVRRAWFAGGADRGRQSVAGPVSALLIVGYFASFLAIGQPDSGWPQLLSLFPLTAPLAMPNRIAMGVAAW